MIKNKILLGFLVVGISFVLISGFRPDPYLIHSGDIQFPYPYPWGVVLWSIGRMIGQTLLLQAALNKKSVIRTSFVLLIGMMIFWVYMIMSLHAPPTWVADIVWTGIFTIVAFIIWIASLYQFLYLRRLPS